MNISGATIAYAELGILIINSKVPDNIRGARPSNIPKIMLWGPGAENELIHPIARLYLIQQTSPSRRGYSAAAIHYSSKPLNLVKRPSQPVKPHSCRTIPYIHSPGITPQAFFIIAKSGTLIHMRNLALHHFHEPRHIGRV
ncbi:hypothetical protein TNCT_497631 [Trichonephila clavata]|uniref:Uncharacterized protein n=1 Tax=Trichonephila clavata TaxID=2740835 RepID=A0A8X6G0C5_TRICU|nr:hypothetical protein TNCT_497631 [Trichonephila clavata]